MHEKKIGFGEEIAFVIKTIILFGFFYEFVPFFMPSTLYSSRKIGFVVAAAYFFIKGYNVRTFFKDKSFKSIFWITLVCIVYSFFLMRINSGKGELVIVWYVFFIMYALLGSIFFAGLFDWDFEKLLKAVAIVTLVQAIWSILTYYNDGIRMLNSTLFVIAENENIDFLDTARLRSIGAAGSGLSVYLAFSSFSFLYFIIKGKQVLLNILCMIVSLFATFLAGTTGLLVFTASIPLTLYIVNKGKKRGVMTGIVLALAIVIFYNNLGHFFDEDQYSRLTRKYISLVENKADDSTVRALTSEQEVSGISLTTIIGTGFSRGRVSSGEMCDHDGGYIRNYFGVGLIMSLIFYFILFWSMFRMTKGLERPVRLLLVLYVILCMGVEYKEPFIFSYIPIFIFLIFVFGERKQLNIEKQKTFVQKNL